MPKIIGLITRPKTKKVFGTNWDDFSDRQIEEFSGKFRIIGITTGEWEDVYKAF